MPVWWKEEQGFLIGLGLARHILKGGLFKSGAILWHPTQSGSLATEVCAQQGQQFAALCLCGCFSMAVSMEQCCPSKLTQRVYFEA